MKKFIARAGVLAATGAVATFGFASTASASDNDGWSWYSAPVSENDGWSWYSAPAGEKDGFSWLSFGTNGDHDGVSWT